MIYFTLPNFFEFLDVNQFMATIAKTVPQILKEPITFIQTSGGFTYNYWTGSYCNMVGDGSYFKDFTMASRGEVMMPLRLLYDSVVLEEEDFVNTMNQNILEFNNTGSNIIEIANIPLMDYISEKYDKYKYVFSKQADLITPFTPELVNQIIDFNKFQFIGVPDRLASDYEFLESISKPFMLEVTVNPRCPASCKHYNECMVDQHYKQLEFSVIDTITPCRSNCLNKKVITLDEIKKEYIPRGINHFTFASQNSNFVTEIDIISFYIYYFVKPEHQFPILLQWQKYKESKGAVMN